MLRFNIIRVKYISLLFRALVGAKSEKVVMHRRQEHIVK